jgi:uncharacterized protein YqgC (DUF456 family)
MLLLASLAGCLLPILPGPPLAYLALLLRHFFTMPDGGYSTILLVVLGIAMLVVSALDYLLPGWLIRKTGGSQYGSRGAMVGMIAGIFLTPIGMLLGMFLGAFIGEWLYNRNIGASFKMTIYSFIGFLLSTGIKFIYCIIVGWYFFFP